MDASGAADISGSVVTLVVLWGLILVIAALGHRSRVGVAPALAKSRRPLKPKTGDDCALCKGQRTPKAEDRARGTPRPWSDVRSRRGPKKRSDTKGFACDNVTCGYYGITDATIHALVAYGGHGKHEWIQDLYCRACHHKFTVRRHTVLYRLKTRSARVAEALAFLVEGVDVSVLERTWGIGEGTLHTWLTRAGVHAAKFHEHFFQRLKFQHLQLDELWANAR